MTREQRNEVLDYFLLKAKYENAIIEKKENFIFNGQEILTKYAKYLLEELQTRHLIKEAEENGI